MKSIAEGMHNFDRENFRRVTTNLPEIQDHQQQRDQAERTAEIFNNLFRQLLAVFPALASKKPDELDEMRRQWLFAFKENGITSTDQVDAGMRVARQQDKPFMPSPGQFIAWCKSEEAIAAGLPDANELMNMIYQYCRKRGQYPDAESYPWKCNAHYWLVTTLYQNMRANSLSDSELRRRASDELGRMVRRLNAGETIPEPVKQLPKLGGRPLTNEQGLNKIAEIRARFGLGKGRNHG
ncbi:TPA: replication protein P [Raoultella ornithinolytica]